VMYAIKFEGMCASPDRITLEMFRRDPSDTYDMLLMRWTYTHVLCAAGMAVDDDQHDDGAGVLRGEKGRRYPPQWANGELAQDLMNEVAEVARKLTEPELKRL